MTLSVSILVLFGSTPSSSEELMITTPDALIIGRFIGDLVDCGARDGPGAGDRCCGEDSFFAAPLFEL